MDAQNMDGEKKQDFSILRGFRDPKIIISILALIVSIFALVNNRLTYENAFRPLLYIDVGDSQSPTSCFGLFIRNNGMGPARIITVDMRFDGRSIQNPRDAQRVISQAGFPGQPIDFEILAVPIENEMIIGAGQESYIYAGRKSRTSNLAPLTPLLRRVSIHITYSSITGHIYKVKFPQ